MPPLDRLVVTVPFGSNLPGPPLYSYAPVPTYTDTNVPEMTAQQAEAVAKGENDREKIWKTLDQEKYRIRRRMKEKYSTLFDPSK
jgi:hypothetical protein